MLVDGSGYRAEPRRRTRTTGLYAKPTGLGTYMLYDAGRLLMSVTSDGAVGRTGSPGKRAEWALRRLPGHRFAIRSAASGRQLAVTADGRLVLIGPRIRGRRRAFHVFRHPLRCRRYPEAAVGASGRPFRGKARRGKFFGFVDAHLHITADMRAGGRVISGKAFDRFGITEALGHDEDDHGPDGASTSPATCFERARRSAPTTSTGGRRSPAGPCTTRYTHQQTYYVWLKRAWKAGERLVVAQTVEDEPLCKIEPRRSHSCDETATIKLEIKRLRGSAATTSTRRAAGRAGAGSGSSTARARRKRVIKRGQARGDHRGRVVRTCSAAASSMDSRTCTRADVDRGIERYRQLRRAQHVHRPLGGQRVRRRGARGRRARASFINGMERASDRRATSRPGPARGGPGRGGGALGLPILRCLSAVLPRREPVLGRPEPGLPGRAPVQRQGPDRARGITWSAA